MHWPVLKNAEERISLLAEKDILKLISGVTELQHKLNMCATVDEYNSDTCPICMHKHFNCGPTFETKSVDTRYQEEYLICAWQLINGISCIGENYTNNKHEDFDYIKQTLQERKDRVSEWLILLNKGLTNVRAK